MVTHPSLDLVLASSEGSSKTLGEWLTTFHLFAVVVDPYSLPSAHILKTGRRLLAHFSEADCRTAWIVTGPKQDAEEFLGEAADDALVFCDPHYEATTALGLSSLPALLHVGSDGVAVTSQGWQPAEWSQICSALATTMKWSKPRVPAPGDPAAFEGAVLTDA